MGIFQKIIGGAVMAFAAAGVAEARDGVTVTGALFYANDAEQGVWNASPEGTTSAVRYDANLTGGFKYESGLLLGVKYLSHSATERYAPETSSIADPSASSAPTTDPSVTRSASFSAIGLGIGYISEKGLYGMVSLMLNPVSESEATSITASGTSYSKYYVSGGYGLLIDVGFRYMLGNLGVGPQLSYTTTSYRRYQAVDASGPSSGKADQQRETHVLPYLALWLEI